MGYYVLKSYFVIFFIYVSVLFAKSKESSVPRLKVNPLKRIKNYAKPLTEINSGESFPYFKKRLLFESLEEKEANLPVPDISKKSDEEVAEDINKMGQQITKQADGSLIVSEGQLQNKYTDEDEGLFWEPHLDYTAGILPTDKWSIRFLLYTLKNPNDGQIMTFTTEVSETNWDIGEDCVFFIHGWLQNAKEGRLLPSKHINVSKNIKNAFMESNRTENVIVVDWHFIAGHANYFSAAKDIRVVGEFVGDMIISLKVRKFLQYAQVTLVGFSLGAHMAGFAGYYIKQKINRKVGRITGLDPAGPTFDDKIEKDLRLDKSDAEFVDVIHCNAGELVPYRRLGTTKKSGHIDFYPNGGADQPGCDLRDIAYISECSHVRCTQLYASTVRGKVYKGCQCKDNAVFRAGKCHSCNGPPMGYLCPKNSTGVYYMKAIPEPADNFDALLD